MLAERAHLIKRMVTLRAVLVYNGIPLMHSSFSAKPPG